MSLIHVGIEDYAFMLCAFIWRLLKGIFHKHQWINIKYDTYPQDERICIKCFKHEELLYDFLTFDWREIK